MIEYIIKSTISLTVLYSLYYLFLRNLKTFEFNRFYLLLTLIFSLAIPFIQFTTEIKLPVSQNIHDYTFSIHNITTQRAIENEQAHNNTFNLIDFLVIIYFFVSTILLIRFIFNFYKIIKTIKNSICIAKISPIIVLSTNNSLPYSFLNYIIVNEIEYENGNIKSDLILHEQAHCKQKHSIDILLIEIIKIIFWFNPILWILKKEIQLNHEYLADKSVLQLQNLKDYQNTLLNLVFRNNSTYLASDFNFSLTKKRLIMMTKNDSLVKSMARRIVIVPMVLILTVTMTFSQKELVKDSLSILNNEWWNPLLQKHNIKLLAFNNYKTIFEMGQKCEVANNNVNIEDATVILLDKKANTYSVVKADTVMRDIQDKTIKATNDVTIMCYNYSNDSLMIRIESSEVTITYDETGRSYKICSAPGTKKYDYTKQ